MAEQPGPTSPNISHVADTKASQSPYICIGYYVALLIVESFIGLFLFDFVALVRGFPRLHALARRFPLAKRQSGYSEAQVCRAVAEACVWYPRRAFCLQRSWVASLLLRRHGIASQIVIGFRPAPFDSHAWVEVGGQVVNDRPQYQKFYQVIDRL